MNDLVECIQVTIQQVMDPARRGRGYDNKGPEPWETKWTNKMEGRIGRKLVEHFIAKAATTYREETNEGIRRLIDNWEGQVKHELELDDEI